MRVNAMSGLISYSELQQSAPLPVAIDYPAALALRQMALIQGKLPKYLLAPEVSALHHYVPDLHRRMLLATLWNTWHCCKVSDEAAFCLIQRPYISKTLLTRRISPRGSP
ncbi:hypothetical protein HMPREF9543_03550 [Escherichia coli MS 146-1]|nr:hypothetical protein HMPREF9543_03550 [Escherichia coli MS 146-1]